VPFLAATLVLSLWLGYQSLDAMRSQRYAAEQALRDYASVAAWEYSRLAREDLGDFLDVVLDEVPSRVRRRSLPPPSIVRREMDDALRSLDCRCEALRESSAYFRLGLRDDDAAIQPALVDAAAVERLRAALREAAARGPRARMQLRTASAGDLLRAEPAVVGFAVTRDSVGPHTAYGFFAPARALRDLFERWHRTGELLPPAIGGGIPNDSLLHIAVRDPAGVTLFESAVSFPPSFPVQDTIGARYASLVVEVWTRPDAASHLIIGGLPRSKLPLTLTLLVLTLGVGAAALVQLRRERQLARIRDDFISGVSHELRTPLAQIRLFAELEETGKLRTVEERRRAIRVIHREAERLTHLVENILRFSRLRRAPSADVLLREEIPLADAVAELAHGFAPLAGVKGMQVRVAIEDGLAVVANRDALNQILVNLLDNAVKYGPRGQTITVQARRHEGAARIEVLDEGPGIPPRDRHGIWEPYRRLARDVDARRSGTGIGLAVVSELVGLQGGAVRVEDAPGGGARFVVELPAARVAARAPAGPPAREVVA
jgi:signal transduction histidine kinase